MPYWFTDQTIGVDERGQFRVGDRFALEIQALVKDFGLTPPVKSSVKISKKPVQFDFKDGLWASLLIKRFEFGSFVRVEGNLTPIFKFDVVITSPHPNTDKPRTAFKGKILVYYPPNFPRRYPLFLIPKYEGRGPSHDDHMIDGGFMCLYGDFGNSRAAWSKDDTIAAAWRQAVKWICWHEGGDDRFLEE